MLLRQNQFYSYVGEKAKVLLPLPISLGMVLLFGNGFQQSPAPAQDEPQCAVPGYLLQNRGDFSYDFGGSDPISGVSNSTRMAIITGGPVVVNASGVTDANNNRVTGAFAGALADELINLGFTQQEATTATIAVTIELSQLPIDSSFRELAIAGRNAIIEAVPARAATVQALQRETAQETTLEIISNLSRTILIGEGFTEAEAETAVEQGLSTLATFNDDSSANEAFEAVFQASIGAVPARQATLVALREELVEEMRLIRQGVRSSIEQGDPLFFDFVVTNTTDRALRFQVPEPGAIQRLTTGAEVARVTYFWSNQGDRSFLVSDCALPAEPEQPGTPPPSLPPQPGSGTEEPTAETPGQTLPSEPPTLPPTSGPQPQVLPQPELPALPEITEVTAETPPVIIPPEGQIQIRVEVEVGPIPQTGTGITVVLDPQEQEPVQQTVIVPPPITPEPLRDPLGRITGCAGEMLPDYNGFSVGLYRPNPGDPTGGIQGLASLTPTEVPDRPNNNIQLGLGPNTENANPFFVTNGDGGAYNFLLDMGRGQLDPGTEYILLVSPPAGSIYEERRIRLRFGDRNGNNIVFTATSLDGRPISSTDGGTSIQGTIQINDAERVGLNLAVLDFDTGVCEAQEIQITKTGDRIVAEPGDTVVYRLAVRNLAATPLNSLVISDRLPLGLQFRGGSVRAALGETQVSISSRQDGRNIVFDVPDVTLASGETLNIAYAARVTPDAIRGNGRNSASVNGQRVDNFLPVRDGPAIHQLRIDPGILSNCGTLIGRVFVDKNFDGEQQANEPGVPNAVVFLDDGNRIITDDNGLFSLANVVSGYRSGVLDLASLPGYAIAPNLKFSERNSQSRLVRLEPGGIARMNFAVTPASEEEF